MAGPAPRLGGKQAFGKDYSFSGQISEALPIPDFLEVFLDLQREAVDVRLNGLLVEWYDASLGHYIGQHREIPQHSSWARRSSPSA